MLDDGDGVAVVLRLDEGGDERLDEIDVLRVDLQRLLEDLNGLVEHAALQQHAADAVVLFQRLAGLADLRMQIGELDVNVDRLRVELGDLAIDHQRVSGIAVLEVVVGENLVLALRLHRQTLLRVEVGELAVDLELRRVELVDLLVDGDGFEEEAVARVVVGDLAEGLDGLVVAVDAHPEVADAIQGVDVVRVVVEKALVFLDRRLDLALGDELLCIRDDLIALDRHLLRSSRTASSALPPLRTTYGAQDSARTPSVQPDETQWRTPDCV